MKRHCRAHSEHGLDDSQSITNPSKHMQLFKYTQIDESVIKKVNIDPKLESEVLALREAIGNSDAKANHL